MAVSIDHSPTITKTNSHIHRRSKGIWYLLCRQSCLSLRLAYFGVLVHFPARFVNKAWQTPRVVLRLIPKQSRRRTQRLARFFNIGRFWIFRVEKREIHGASVQRAINGARNNQTRFCRKIMDAALVAKMILYAGISEYTGAACELFNPHSAAKQPNPKEMTIRGWIIYPVR